MSIEAIGVSKRFGAFQALRDVSVEVPHGSLLALLGPSGSGKTTLLRTIAGLEAPDTGTVLIDGADMTSIDVRDRGIGFVFQHYALFKHMTVADNIGFALRIKRCPKAEVRERVDELIALFRLEGLAGRLPEQLSGGQRQRVALARALAAQPEVLLLDEPFGALDAKVRLELRRWLRRLHDQIGVTTVFVTHDQEEALEVADRIVVMNAGRIEQIGSPEEVFKNPANEFVMEFLGNVNVFHGRVHGGVANAGPLVVEAPGVAPGTSANARVYFRPYDVDLHIERPERPHFPAVVVHVNPAGPRVKIELEDTEKRQVFAEIDWETYDALGVSPGDRLYASPRETRVFFEDYSI
ncbi:MAG: sulfate/molybdate ABC transporter ATP-binding protein [Actinobacteria bacterium]|nr:sulfate/molybdate ABC transporter ATP-binding protein [Actinomycetota bacterium]MCL5887734.1 sulfate/molybdate ABC transporter ATP-binding protein [Actinomycetota bacterium]